MVENTSLSTNVESNAIDLAVAGWLDAHSKSKKTLKAYAVTHNSSEVSYTASATILIAMCVHWLWLRNGLPHSPVTFRRSR